MRLLLAAAVLGCAPHPGATPARSAPSSPERRVASTATCVVADSSAQTRDTLYVVGFEPRTETVTPTECALGATALAPVTIAETPPPDADLRDVLDRGLPATHAPRPDVVITRDPGVLGYAARSAEYFIVVLPYDRTYLLVAADSAPTMLSQTERDALARDAVTADTRGAVPPFAWLADATCAAPFAPASAPPKAVVAFATGDAIARELAERIVALARARSRIAPMAADSIAGALATGRVAGAVIALPRDPRARCGTPSGLPAWRGVPLVDSRAHAIVRRGSGAAFIIGADGSLRFTRRGAP